MAYDLFYLLGVEGGTTAVKLGSLVIDDHHRVSVSPQSDP